MFHIESIDFDFFRITGYPDGSDWIMGPGFRQVGSHGTNGDRLVWFIDRKKRLRIFDALERSLLSEHLLPGDGTLVEICVGRGGEGAYVLSSTGNNDPDVLTTIDLLSGDQHILLSDFHASWGHAPIEKSDGRLLIATRDHRARARRGLILFDPATGARDESWTDAATDFDWPRAHRRSDALSYPSPDGRYWLKADLMHLPACDVAVTPKRPRPKRKSDLRLGRTWQVVEPLPSKLVRVAATTGLAALDRVRPLSSQVERRYGLTVQLWESFPLRFVRRIAVAWLSLNEFPGMAGNKDLDDRVLICEMLTRLAATQDPGSCDPPARSSFPEPFSSDDAAWSMLGNQVADWPQTGFAGWEPDGSAFWWSSNGFLTCAGVDGTVSPPLFLQRIGLKEDGPPAPIEAPNDITPLPGRRARVQFRGGTPARSGEAIVDGQQSDTPFTPRAIAVEKDRWRSHDRKSRERISSALDALKQEQHTLRVELKDWSESACIDAVDQLIAQIDETIADRAADYEIQAVFIRDGKVLGEDVFFPEAARQFPGIAPSLQRLIEHYCDTAPSSLSWQNEDKVIGALGFAAYALGVIDEGSLQTLRRYGMQVDMENEDFFPHQTFPAVINAHGWTDQVVDFSIWMLLKGFDNALQPKTMIWVDFGMRDAVIDRFSPEQFADRVQAEFERAELRRYEPSETHYGMNGIDSLAGDLSSAHAPDDLPSWERDFLHELARREERRLAATT